MRTTILAYVIALMGLVMIATGIYGLLILAGGDDDRVPSLADYAIVAALISAGLGLGGLAQALRLLLEINRRR
jgi:hypothetical protein